MLYAPLRFIILSGLLLTKTAAAQSATVIATAVDPSATPMTLRFQSLGASDYSECETPCTMTLPRGPAELTLTAAGFDSLSRRFVVADQLRITVATPRGVGGPIALGTIGVLGIAGGVALGSLGTWAYASSLQSRDPGLGGGFGEYLMIMGGTALTLGAASLVTAIYLATTRLPSIAEMRVGAVTASLTANGISARF